MPHSSRLILSPFTKPYDLHSPTRPYKTQQSRQLHALTFKFIDLVLVHLNRLALVTHSKWSRASYRSQKSLLYLLGWKSWLTGNH